MTDMTRTTDMAHMTNVAHVTNMAHMANMFLIFFSFFPIALWIMAAKWEMEDRLSSESARQLFLRALRFHPECPKLYQEVSILLKM